MDLDINDICQQRKQFWPKEIVLSHNGKFSPYYIVENQVLMVNIKNYIPFDPIISMGGHKLILNRNHKW